MISSRRAEGIDGRHTGFVEILVQTDKTNGNRRQRTRL